MSLGADIKTALDALAEADKRDMAKVWTAIGDVISGAMLSELIIDSIEDSDEEIPSGGELFEFNTPDVVSSLGRTFIGSPIYNYFPAKITEQGIDSYDNHWRKWNNRGVIGVFKEGVNLVSSPEDLTDADWSKTNATATLSDFYISGHRFSKLLATDTNGSVWQDITFTGNAIKSVSIIVKKGDDATTIVMIRDTDAAADRLHATITWATEDITCTTGSVLEAFWIDANETVELHFVTTAIIAGNVNRLRVRIPTDTKYSYFTDIQTENSIYSTPYILTSRPIGKLDFPLTMPSQFTIMFWLRPWFSFDTSIGHRFVDWYIDGTHRLRIRYYVADDQICVEWQDGGTSRRLVSQQFDDGSAEEDINAWIHVAVKIDLTTGDTTGSSLWINAVKIDDVWGDGNIDAKSSSFNILSIGYENDLQHADALLTDFLYADSLLADAAIEDHYSAGRPFYAVNRLLGKNSEFRIDKFGNAYFKNMVVR